MNTDPNSTQEVNKIFSEEQELLIQGFFGITPKAYGKWIPKPYINIPEHIQFSVIYRPMNNIDKILMEDHSGSVVLDENGKGQYKYNGGELKLWVLKNNVLEINNLYLPKEKKLVTFKQVNQQMPIEYLKLLDHTVLNEIYNEIIKNNTLSEDEKLGLL